MSTIPEQSETRPLLSSRPENGNLVELSGPDDPLNFQSSMPQWRKWTSAALLGATTFAATFSSAVFAAVTPRLAKELQSSPEHMALATTLFVFGFAAGPIIMGPASEVFGRKLPLFSGYLIFALSQIPVAMARNVQTILIWRFIGGVASSGSPAIVGGYLADFLLPVERGVAAAIFAATTLMGPPIGAIVGSSLLYSPLGWRWAAWLSLIVAVVFGTLAWLVVPETYVPVLLQRKARRLRLETGDWALHAKADEVEVSTRYFIVRYLARPFAMLVLEPILLLMTLYASFTFGMVYLLFIAYSYSFVQERHFSPVTGTLPLIAIVVGIIIGSAFVTRYTFTTFAAKVRAQGKISPEDRLPPMILGAVIFPVGLFWFAAASDPEINAWPQIISGIALGAGIQIITLQSIAYIIDIYGVNSNSAISGTIIVRSLLGGLFPVIAVPMYQRLGAQVATSIVGMVSTVFIIIPVLLLYFGGRIRSWSKFSETT